ncbi:GYDIA family GHMP kinase [Gaetbulibacter aestuarii]|uniref:GYDIA family GHMP kinase n=1 Tax=Gaetbulibacter aestuarii TaxID=1502358 RepID=A0ABW7N1Y5_9FLAO
MKTFSSHGKLLLSAEYVILDGALALALPTTFGQNLNVEPSKSNELIWKSLDNQGNIWYEDKFTLKKLERSKSPENEFSNRLIQILRTARDLNPGFLTGELGFKVTTHLDFQRDWGLGSSSTLINNIANWAEIDPYTLLERTFGGSGYDIACAQSQSPILYQIKEGSRLVKPVKFDPNFKSQLYFVYLNRKQNSREGISHYRANKKNKTGTIAEINLITERLLECKNLPAFEEQLDLHETLIAEITKQTPVKDLYFKDFTGHIKSLGAWGGDFILATSESDPRDYFKSKGFNTVINYTDMIL